MTSHRVLAENWYVILIFVLTGGISACSFPQSEESPLTLEDLEEQRYAANEPSEAVETFETQDGFEMQLIASEPLVYDPVAMVYDENGRAYVAEMSDYPYTDQETAEDWEEQTNQDAIGRVRMLEDTDGDGTFDESTIFAENLSWPTGLGVWKGGIYVLATPHIWYYKDTTGDRKADVQRKVFTGFRKFNVQAVINNLQFGLDHQFYGAGSSNGGEIRPANRPDAEAVNMSRNDFSFSPDGTSFQLLSGGARFGNTVDDWGNRFICDIRNPVQHVVLPDRYLKRNPYLPIPSAIHDAAEAGDQIPVFGISPAEPWRKLRAQQWSSDPSTSSRMPRSELAAQGYWTSSSGITIYRGEAYPEEYYGDVFIGEVANNIIHRQDRSRDGVTFSSVRADQNTEFVASRDTWFRGVNLVNAPDGTLHVLDMYREVIEHPWSIPDEILAEIDLRSGTDRGRIYRLAPPNFTPPEQPRLGEASTSALVAELENPNAWWRDTAHRLIYERQDESAAAPLRQLLQSSEKPVARLHALWSLEGLDALRREDLQWALNDESAGVRKHAVQLAEKRLNESPPLMEKVIAMAEDPDERVRFQVAFTLGETDDPRASSALVGIARQDASSQWTRTAILSSATETSEQILIELLKDDSFMHSSAGQTMSYQLAMVVGARNQREEVNQLFSALGSEGERDWIIQQTVVRGLGEGLNRSNMSLREVAADISSQSEVLVDQVLETARRRAVDEALSVEERRQAIELLAYDAWDTPRLAETLQTLLDPARPQELQMAAVQTLSEFADPEATLLLIDRWGRYTPALRGEVTEALTSRQNRIEMLLDAVENGAIPVQQLSSTAQSQLLDHDDDTIRSRAEDLFTASGSASRAEVVEEYQQTLTLEGNPGAGEQIYQQRCQTCHRAGQDGSSDVGPNLASIRHKSSDEILLHIIDPNLEVSPDYELYQVERTNGKTATGVIAAETPTSVTLKRAGGVEETILRRNIGSITSTGTSLMPEGLEAGLSEQDMADLIAFLRQGGEGT